MNEDKLASELEKMISNKFEIEHSNDSNNNLASLSPESIVNKKVVRFCRIKKTSSDNRFYKTILIVKLDNEELLRDTFTWTTLVKEALGNPESSDLYLFICWDEKSQPMMEECIRVEASEEFCRKYVCRPKETYEAFLERTFVKDISDSSQGLAASDPLINAFKKLSSSFEWFDDIEQDKWQKAFQSGKSGMDLVEMLFDLKNKNNDAP